MKKTMNEKKGYVAPQMAIVKMQSMPMLNSVSASGPASDIGYDGLGSDGEFGD